MLERQPFQSLIWGLHFLPYDLGKGLAALSSGKAVQGEVGSTKTLLPSGLTIASSQPLQQAQPCQEEMRHCPLVDTRYLQVLTPESVCVTAWRFFLNVYLDASMCDVHGQSQEAPRSRGFSF